MITGRTPMYFPKGGGTLKGVSKPGEIVWSRVFIWRRGLCSSQVQFPGLPARTEGLDQPMFSATQPHFEA